MKYSELYAIADYLQGFGAIGAARRIGENRLVINFLAKNSRANFNEKWIADFANNIFAPIATLSNAFDREFNAPFDLAVAKFFSGSLVRKITIDDRDKIIKIFTEKSDRYKTYKYALILEFAPNRLNALLTDENFIVIESLRRTVKLQEVYAPPAPMRNDPKITEIADIKSTLLDRLSKIADSELEKRKNIEVRSAENKQGKLLKTLNDLSDPKKLEIEAEKAALEGSLILANINLIKPYSSEIKLIDFDGKEVVVKLEKKAAAAIEAERKFALSKRLRSKAKGLEIEYKNLSERIEFYDRLISAVKNAKNINDLEIILPKKQKAATKKSASEPIEEFIVGGFRLLMGRNEKGNEIILKRAKPRDLWFHLQNKPGAHLIIQSAKENISEEVIKKAAEICARFSAGNGAFLVDYTKRQFVKIDFGAHVTYARQKTIKVIIE
ncbi:MAG: NFACT RNA binding domain-containing protein [Helicobacteraceae bacterium]|nr:NFACT RNA binding domain-containing protein [Helicobacteraceae bacterium]